MRIHACLAGVSALILVGCVPEYDLGPADADIRSDPSILHLAVGQSKPVLVEAFLDNEPESVRWSIGRVNAGVHVELDSSYGTMYVGNQLTVPERAHSRRYTVTMTDTLATSFIISGGTGIIEIPVRPPVVP
jgi:hypothetical protein